MVSSTLPLEPILPLKIIPLDARLFTDVTTVPCFITEPETFVPFTEVNVIEPLFLDIVLADFILLVFTNCSKTLSSNVLTTPVPFANILPGTSIFEDTISISFAARTLPAIFTTPSPAFLGSLSAE